MNDAIITGAGDYLTRDGRRVTVVEPLRSGAARGMVLDQLHVWNDEGVCLSGDRGLDIVGRYPG